MRGQRSDWPDRRLAAHRGDQALDRSSVATKGSLQSTVRCAWSLSFRCTQSTVVVAPLLRSTDEVAAGLALVV